MAQLLHHRIDLLGVGSPGVENGFDIVEDYKHFPGRKEWSERGQVFQVLDACPNDRRESTEEMRGRGGELIASDEPAVDAKPFLDAIVMKDGQGNGSLANPADTNEGDRSEVLRKTGDLRDQLVASEEDSWWWGWGLPRYARWKYKISDPLVVEFADLF